MWSLVWGGLGSREELLLLAVVLAIDFYLVYLAITKYSQRQERQKQQSFLSRLVPCALTLLSTNAVILPVFSVIATHEVNLATAGAIIAWLLGLLGCVLLLKKGPKVHEESNGDDLTAPLLASSEAALLASLPVLPEVINVGKESVWSRMTFGWMSKLIKFGSKKTLTLDDLPKLATSDLGTAQYEKFHSKWELRGQKYPGKPQSVAWVIWDTYWRSTMGSGLVALVYLVAQYAGPVMLGVLVDFASQEERPIWTGLGFVLFLALAKAAEAVTERVFWFEVERTGLWIRGALLASVYRKSLLLSNEARAEHGAGQLVNYVEVDVDKIGEFAFLLNESWMLPVQTIFALFILFRTVGGWGALSGLAVIIVCIALQIPLARQVQVVQKQLMGAKDVRMRSTTEALKSMRVVKLWAWEDGFRSKIESLRKEEFRLLAVGAGLKTANVSLLYFCPLLVAVVTLGTCVLVGVPLTSAKVFTAIATFRIISEPLFYVPMLIGFLVEVSVSLARLNKFLHADELQMDAVDRLPLSSKPSSLAIAVTEGSFKWGNQATKEEEESKAAPKGEKSSSPPAANGDTAAAGKEKEGGLLKGINLEVTGGAKVAVCGTVGSGKSSLLSCLLGEMTRLSGKVSVAGRVAYVPQSAWIQSGSIEANILFGCPMERQRYEEALRVCALRPDLAILPAGDQTEIGERGINISGGQKQRIQLARALYQDADVYLLDDPFSAVDAHTGSELFRELVAGALAAKTVVLVTHQVEFLPAVDQVLVMRGGEIIQAGRCEELLNAGTDFLALVSSHNAAMEAVDSTTASAAAVTKQVETAKTTEAAQPDPALVAADAAEALEGGEVVDVVEATGGTTAPIGQLVKDEEREEGQVEAKVYIMYLRQIWGGALIPFILLALIAYELAGVAANSWLAYATTPENNVSPEELVRTYSFLVLGSVGLVTIRTAAVNFAGIVTAQRFFQSMLASLFRAPMHFFDTTPSGRILARASSDQKSLDLEIPTLFSGTARSSMALIAIVALTSYITPQVLITSMPCFVAALVLQRYYLKTSREVKRVLGTSSAPIINHFSESIAGSATIRAFGQGATFLQREMDAVDANNRPVLYSNGASNWFMLRLKGLAIALFSIIALSLILMPAGLISPALVGLSLAYGLSLESCLETWAWFIAQLETKIIAVERVCQFIKLPEEAPAIVPTNRPQPGWPEEGTVEFQDLQVRYRADTPLVLDGLSCVIAGGSKVGVVGRTGSGKSTLVLALFRIVEPAGGRIIIDRCDIATLGLRDLRQHLGIIPQEPTLFQGTVRGNLDPLDEYTDERVWEALEKCQLAEVVRAKELKLQTPVLEGGENWSVGQRQLFCLGRALLKRARILVLDEATASVDSTTDALIQNTLATSGFAGCTVISVAHRIPTVIDSDKVLLLEKGRLQEYDSPRQLLMNPHSMFSKLVSEYSTRSSSLMGSNTNLAALGVQP
eukprot:TRINITY_DN2775_c0_g2_i1.p1 TRINITY_DN2775_c0_g2~~TRINITY_DN2775_c0_g2_i1.p1  ORF type:complete len:1462 (+),score=304.89 TRINITY_DN2775_c0_g2_i1:622-5007(+)